MVIPPRFVLDASFTLPWIFRDEDNTASRSAWDALIAGDATAFVPPIWQWEITNVVARAVPSGRVTISEMAMFFDIIEKMPITVTPFSIGLVFAEVPDIMQKHGLTGYDAGYLATAMKQNLPLATLDKALGKAASASGIELINNYPH